MRTLVHDETGSLLAQDLLHAPDGVTVVIKEKTNAAKQSHILWPVIAASATTLHRLELSEFCFPEAKHVLRDFQLIGNFTDRTKGLGRFVHRSNSPPLIVLTACNVSPRLFGRLSPGQRVIDTLFHDVARPEHENTPRRNRNFLARLRVASDPLPLVSNPEGAG